MGPQGRPSRRTASRRWSAPGGSCSSGSTTGTAIPRVTRMPMPSNRFCSNGFADSATRTDASRGGGGELAAGSVDVLATGVTNGGGDPGGAQTFDELLLHPGSGRRPLRAGGRVERDRVDVNPAAAAGIELV